ncbi:uncharacterized protein LOC126810474 [Patella vulgata]|uniref:uncharacterized protein LOC126810474 n=1 Tax=Patella vulgata TaxID=6465 RepID=UPI0024A7FCC2|nr:uncharacterized protein LOC126810474 [Patella vulgata]
MSGFRSLYLLLIIATLSFLTQAFYLNTVCQLNQRADIVILVGDSRSTMRMNWFRPTIAPGVLTFITNFIRRLDFTMERVGIMAVSDTVRLVSPLTNIPATLYQRMMTWRPQFGGAKTYRGLLSVRQYLGSESSPNCKKFVILLTNRNSENSALTRQQAADAKREGVNIISVGFSSSRTELSDLRAIIDDDDDMFWSNNDSLLPSLIVDILNEICEETNTNVPSHSVVFESDIVLIIDDSESTRTFSGTAVTHDAHLGTFVKQMAINMDFTACRLGVVMVSKTGRAIVDLGTDLAGINTAIDNFTGEFVETRTEEGYKAARLMLDSVPRARNQYVMLVADGTSFDNSPISVETTQLEEAEVNLGLLSFGTVHGNCLTPSDVNACLQSSAWQITATDSTEVPSKAAEIANYVCPNI